MYHTGYNGSLHGALILVISGSTTHAEDIRNLAVGGIIPGCMEVSAWTTNVLIENSETGTRKLAQLVIQYCDWIQKWHFSIAVKNHDFPPNNQ